MVTTETVRCQLLYELQGNIYLHSDVKAYLNDVSVTLIGKDRQVQMSTLNVLTVANGLTLVFRSAGSEALLHLQQQRQPSFIEEATSHSLC
jgi:hypothetical protein